MAAKTKQQTKQQTNKQQAEIRYICNQIKSVYCSVS